MLIKPTPSRFTVDYSVDSIRVTLPTKKRVLFLPFFLAWIFFFIIIIIMLTGVLLMYTAVLCREIFQNADYSVSWFLVLLFFLLWLTSIFYGIQGVYIISWELFGKEIIEKNSHTFCISKQIFRWKRSRNFSIEEVLDIRVNTQYPNNNFIMLYQELTKRNGRIAFDYGAKTYRFGLDIDEAEAKQIIKAINQWQSDVNES